MPEQPPKAVEKLADDINELESLIDGRKTAGPAPAQVPILDDVVESGAAPPAPAPTAGTGELEDRLLRRVDGELVDLSRVIREILRRCIREELARGPDGRTPTPGKPDGD